MQRPLDKISRQSVGCKLQNAMQWKIKFMMNFVDHKMYRNSVCNGSPFLLAIQQGQIVLHQMGFSKVAKSSQNPDLAQISQPCTEALWSDNVFWINPNKKLGKFEELLANYEPKVEEKYPMLLFSDSCYSSKNPFSYSLLFTPCEGSEFENSVGNQSLKVRSTEC